MFSNRKANLLNKGPNPVTMAHKPTVSKDPEEQRWAEVARFNHLLDRKLKLEEVSESKRKAELQRKFLDSQIQVKETQVAMARERKH